MAEYLLLVRVGPLGQGRYTPVRVGNPPPPVRQSNTANTCYMVGNMPLAYTQEDFLVIKCFHFQHKFGISLLTLRSFEKFQQKIDLPPSGIELTMPIITGLEFSCLTHSANLPFLAEVMLC